MLMLLTRIFNIVPEPYEICVPSRPVCSDEVERLIESLNVFSKHIKSFGTSAREAKEAFDKLNKALGDAKRIQDIQDNLSS